MELSLGSSAEAFSLPVTHSEPSTPDALSSRPAPPSSSRVALTPTERIASRLTQTAIANIQGEIMRESFIVPPSARISLFPPQQLHQQSLKLYEIVKKKKELAQEINRLQYEESRIKEQPEKHAQSRGRSMFTKEEHQAIAKALQAQKELQEELEMKNKVLEAKLMQKSKEEEAKQKERIMKFSKQKQIKAVQSLQQLQKRKISRAKEINELNRKFQSVKAQTFLHQKMENRWKDHEKHDEQEMKQMLNERKRQKIFSMKEIIGHQHQYQSFLANNSKEKEEKLLREKLEKEALERQTLSLYEPSKYLQTVFEQQKKQKEVEEQKAQMQRSLLLTRAKYGDSIRQLHKDHLKKKSLPAISEQNQPKTGRARSLSRLEIAQIGNRYIREVHSSIGEVTIKQSSSNSILIPLTKKLPKQQDYLQSMRKKRSQQVQNPQMKELRELATVLSKKTDLKDKLYMAKLVAGKLNQRTQGDTAMLLASINAKLKIIDTFS